MKTKGRDQTEEQDEMVRWEGAICQVCQGGREQNQRMAPLVVAGCTAEAKHEGQIKISPRDRPLVLTA